MKVILLQDVAKIGRRFDVAEVPDGYALNQLIPKQMAEAATPANMKRIERRQAESTATKEAGQASFESAKAALLAEVVTVVVEANDKGHLFKAVHEADIAAAAKEAGVEVDVSMIKISSPIKEIGDHEIVLASGGDTAAFTIKVTKK